MEVPPLRSYHNSTSRASDFLGAEQTRNILPTMPITGVRRTLPGGSKWAWVFRVTQVFCVIWSRVSKCLQNMQLCVK